MKKRVVVAVIALVFVSTNCSLFVRTPSVDTLAENFRQQLINKEFGKIYDDASDHLHMNVSKEEFTERAQRIVAQLEEVDRGLAWQSDDTLGKTSDLKKYEKNTYFTAFRKVGEGTQIIHVLVNWEQEPGSKPRLFDFTALSHSDAPKPFHLFTLGNTNKANS